MNKNNLSLILEVVWWIFTLLLVVGILFPIYSKANATYPFYTSSILFIVVFVTFTRYIFLLKYTFLAHLEKLKLAIILFSAIIGAGSIIAAIVLPLRLVVSIWLGRNRGTV